MWHDVADAGFLTSENQRPRTLLTGQGILSKVPLAVARAKRTRGSLMSRYIISCSAVDIREVRVIWPVWEYIGLDEASRSFLEAEVIIKRFYSTLYASS
jgi:hypothetical protein